VSRHACPPRLAFRDRARLELLLLSVQ